MVLGGGKIVLGGGKTVVGGGNVLILGLDRIWMNIRNLLYLCRFQNISKMFDDVMVLFMDFTDVR